MAITALLHQVPNQNLMTTTTKSGSGLAREGGVSANIIGN